MQRKAEVDLDLRKKAEAERADFKKRLDDETNKRTREQGWTTFSAVVRFHRLDARFLRVMQTVPEYHRIR